MKQGSIRIIADYLAHRPIGRIVSVLPVGDDDYIASIEDRRDGREHVIETPGDLGTWLDSFKQGRCLQPTRGFCDCCGEFHSDHDVDGELFELCTSCQSALTAAEFEEAAYQHVIGDGGYYLGSTQGSGSITVMRPSMAPGQWHYGVWYSVTNPFDASGRLRNGSGAVAVFLGFEGS